MTTLTGFPQMEQKLLQLAKGDKVKKILEEEAQNLLEEVRQNIDALPVSETEKAQLRRSLTITPSPDGLSWTIGSGLEYGESLEYGTENTAGTPWLGLSLITYRGQYCNCLRDRLITSLSTNGLSG